MAELVEGRVGERGAGVAEPLDPAVGVGRIIDGRELGQGQLNRRVIDAPRPLGLDHLGQLTPRGRLVGPAPMEVVGVAAGHVDPIVAGIPVSDRSTIVGGELVGQRRGDEESTSGLQALVGEHGHHVPPRRLELLGGPEVDVAVGLGLVVEGDVELILVGEEPVSPAAQIVVEVVAGHARRDLGPGDRRAVGALRVDREHQGASLGEELPLLGGGEHGVPAGERADGGERAIEFGLEPEHAVGGGPHRRGGRRLGPSDRLRLRLCDLPCRGRAAQQEQQRDQDRRHQRRPSGSGLTAFGIRHRGESRPTTSPSDQQPRNVGGDCERFEPGQPPDFLRFWMLAHSSRRPTVRWKTLVSSGSTAK